MTACMIEFERNLCDHQSSPDHTITGGGEMVPIAFSPDGSRLAVLWSPRGSIDVYRITYDG